MTELVEPATVAVEWGIPESTLAQWRYMRKGPAYVRVGRYVRYRREDLDAWIASQTRGGNAA